MRKVTVLDVSDKEDPGLPPDLRFLKALVTVLTAVMIVGLIAVVALLVTRLSERPAPPVPAALALPDGAAPFAVTQAPGRWIVTTRDGRVLIFDGDGVLTGEVALD